MQTAPGQVQHAVMHTAEMDASTEDLRVTAMHLRSPIHTLMFNSKGDLLGANTSALEACHIHTPGRSDFAPTIHNKSFDLVTHLVCRLFSAVVALLLHIPAVQYQSAWLSIVLPAMVWKKRWCPSCRGHSGKHHLENTFQYGLVSW